MQSTLSDIHPFFRSEELPLFFQDQNAAKLSLTASQTVADGSKFLSLKTRGLVAAVKQTLDNTYAMTMEFPFLHHKAHFSAFADVDPTNRNYHYSGALLYSRTRKYWNTVFKYLFQSSSNQLIPLKPEVVGVEHSVFIPTRSSLHLSLGLETLIQTTAKKLTKPLATAHVRVMGNNATSGVYISSVGGVGFSSTSSLSSKYLALAGGFSCSQHLLGGNFGTALFGVGGLRVPLRFLGVTCKATTAINMEQQGAKRNSTRKSMLTIAGERFSAAIFTSSKLNEVGFSLSFE
ncbi:hypothetical protein RCL1_005065 [Eukaryota sp. TZLM3-RCL]